MAMTNSRNKTRTQSMSISLILSLILSGTIEQPLNVSRNDGGVVPGSRMQPCIRQCSHFSCKRDALFGKPVFPRPILIKCYSVVDY